ncbi:unnamed protein product, partial [Rotaria magnacalcarata]
NNSRTMLKSQISLPTNNISDSPAWDQKPKKIKRQHSHSFGSRNNPMNTTTTQPRKPGRPRRDVALFEY